MGGGVKSIPMDACMDWMCLPDFDQITFTYSYDVLQTEYILHEKSLWRSVVVVWLYVLVKISDLEVVLTEVESALDAVHVASQVGKALVHIMAVRQSREAMLESTFKSLKSAKNVKNVNKMSKLPKRHDLLISVLICKGW